MAEVDFVSDATVNLLWEACRPYPDVAAIRAIVDGGDLQPELVVFLALNHRIGPMLWRALTAAGCDDALGDEGTRLRDLSDTFRMQSLTLHPQAVSMAVSPLTEAGLKPIILKGPTLMERYPEAGLRPMDDIDLFLPAADHQRAIAALLASGWTVSRAMTRGLYDTQFRHPGLPAIPLELHLGLEGWHERSNRINPTWLWEQRIPAEYLGTPAYGLPLEVEVVSLAAHAGKPYHGFDRLIWLVDITMAITDAQARGEVDWERIVELARDTECMSVVTAALHMAARIGLQFPHHLFPLPT
ncbi:MAG TPA: nucleotidyltransferase family protein, partial [Acidimicrobiales bacterium]